MSNSDNKVISNQQHYGGQSSDEAIGTPASFSYSRALDHRRNPSQLTVLPGPRKLNDGVIEDLIMNIVQTQSGVRFGYGADGYIYKIDTSNVVTVFDKLPDGSDGCLYRSDSDAIYLATPTDLRRIYPMSGTPKVDVIYGASRSIDPASYRTGGSGAKNGYIVPAAIAESQACYFQPDIEPFYSIKVNVDTVGTGNLVLTLHDGLNNQLAQVTILAANVQQGLNEFIFSSQIRALVKPNARTYHWHITSTTGDTILTTSSTADSGSNQLDSADFELWAYRFVNTTNGFHPVAQFQQFTLIGNGNYLAVWEPLSDRDPPNNEFQRHRLVFPSGFEVCGIAVTDEFAVIACEKYATDGTKDFQEGKLFLWDGTSTTYNNVIDVSGGSPGSIETHENYPYFFVNGDLCAWAGGKNIVKIRHIKNAYEPYSGIVDNSRVYPNMMAIRDNLLHAGYPSTTNNPAVEYGVYIWGTLEKNFPASFNYGYVNSTGTNLNISGSLRHGCVRNFGDEMYISVQYANGSYGLEIVDNLCDPAPVFEYRARRFDAGAAYRDKQALKIALDTAELPSGVSITPTIRIDSDAEISLTESAMQAGDEHKVATIKQGNFKRALIGFDGTIQPGSSTPIIFAASMEWNPYIDRKAL